MIIFTAEVSLERGSSDATLIIHKVDTDDGNFTRMRKLNRKYSVTAFVTELIELVEKDKPDQLVFETSNISVGLKDEFISYLENRDTNFRMDTNGYLDHTAKSGHIERLKEIQRSINQDINLNVSVSAVTDSDSDVSRIVSMIVKEMRKQGIRL